MQLLFGSCRPRRSKITFAPVQQLGRYRGEDHSQGKVNSPLARGRSGESQLGGEMTDDQSYGHVAVAFAEIARTSLRENGRGNVATDRRFRSPHRRGLRRGRYLSFGRVTGHHAGVLSPPRPRDRFGPIRRGGLGHHKDTLLDESLEGDGKQTSPRREHVGTRVKSANRWLFLLLTSQDKEQT